MICGQGCLEMWLFGVGLFVGTDEQMYVRRGMFGGRVGLFRVGWGCFGLWLFGVGIFWGGAVWRQGCLVSECLGAGLFKGELFGAGLSVGVAEWRDAGGETIRSLAVWDRLGGAVHGRGCL